MYEKVCLFFVSAFLAQFYSQVQKLLLTQIDSFIYIKKFTFIKYYFQNRKEYWFIKLYGFT